MQMRVGNVRLAAMAVLAAIALLGSAPDAPAPASSGAVMSPADPAIIDVSITPEPLQAGKPISIVVHATPSVVSVQGSVLAFKFPVPKTAAGTFSAAGKVPWFARLYHGTFHIAFVGLDAAGARSEMTASVRI
jgi:hypothetical protein